MSEKKNILITGATGGIGEATAEYLLEKGYSLVLLGRDHKKLEALVSRLGHDALFFVYDLVKLDEIGSIFDFLEQRNVKLDGYVHCAGMNYDIAIRSNDLEMMEKVTAVNYMSFVEIMKYFIKKKYSNDGSSVVAVSSRAVLYPAPAMCTYVASKSALDAAVTIAAMEASKRRIRVNSILPGGTDTDMLTRAGITLDQISQRQPLGVISPTDIAYLVEFLLSDRSDKITGAHIPVTAGHL